MLKTMNTIHRTVLKLSGGRFGWETADMPVLELTTTGRRSGQQRSVMLTSPHQDGDMILVVASKGGNDEHPAWFLNLRDNPAVSVKFKGGEPQPMTATIADDATRAALWPIVTSTYKGYAGYQDKTDRTIPLVMLTPRS